MRNNTVKFLRDSLNEILKVDTKATLEFEDCGSDTNVLNIFISKENIEKLTIEDLGRLEKEFGICGDDEGETVQKRFLNGNRLFICLS